MSRCSKPLCLKTLCVSVAVFAAVVTFTVNWSLSQEKKPAPKNPAPPKKPAPSKRPPTAEEAILKALDEPTEISFVKKPLSEVLKTLQLKHKIPIRANVRALEGAGIWMSQNLVTRSLKGVKLRSALNLILAELEMAWIIRGEVLIVTTKEDADVTLVTKVYPVAELLQLNEADLRRLKEYADYDWEPDYESLIQVIEEDIHPDSWSDAGGPGSIAALRGTLVIRQMRDVHREISALLDALRKARQQQDEAKGDARFAVIKAYDHQEEDKLLKALQRRVSFSFTEKPLSEVRNEIFQRYSVLIQFNHRALKDAGVVQKDTLITLKVSGVSLSSALNLMLQELGLAWAIQWEVLMITSQEDADAIFQTRVYPIRDMLFETDDEEDEDFEWVIQAIQDCVQPDSWATAGGPGSIREMANVDSLVCSQTRQVHEQIEKLLANVRKVMPARKASPKEDEEEVIIKAYYVGEPIAYTPKGEEIPDPISAEQAAVELAQILKIIQELVAPRTWNEKDGSGYIRGVSGRIVVRHTRKVQREVRKLLIKLGLFVDPFAFPFHGGHGSTGPQFVK